MTLAEYRAVLDRLAVEVELAEAARRQNRRHR